MLVTLHDLIASARRERFALGAFNTYNMEITTAIVGGAEAVNAPVIVQTGAGALRGPAGVALPALVLALAHASAVPVAVHLDHASDPAQIDQALRAGYSSVMIDGSAEPFETNVALTRQVVQRGHDAGVTVEAELGGMAGDEDIAVATESRVFTDPGMAADFVASTGVDLLAVAVGNVHGLYRGEPELRFQLLEQLSARLPVPLVLHGASGLPDAALIRAIEHGVVKVNFNTELRQALFRATAETIAEGGSGYDVSALIRQQVAAVRAVVEAKLTLLGAAGLAEDMATAG